jgi:hypothetical protein
MVGLYEYEVRTRELEFTEADVNKWGRQQKYSAKIFSPELAERIPFRPCSWQKQSHEDGLPHGILF